jgi:hypothetical protein
MAQDTPLAIVSSAFGFVTFAAAIVAAIASWLGYVYRYRASPEQANIFLSVVNASRSELELFKAQYSVLQENTLNAPGADNHKLLKDVADAIYAEAEAAFIRLQEDMRQSGININDTQLNENPKKRLAWIASGGQLHQRLEERAALTNNLALLKMALLSA